MGGFGILIPGCGFGVVEKAHKMGTPNFTPPLRGKPHKAEATPLRMTPPLSGLSNASEGTRAFA